MKKIFENTTLTFLFLVAVVCIILFIVPINLFDGEVVYDPRTGFVNPIPMKISLSDFTGLWNTEADLRDVQSFYLTGMGWLMVFLMTICLPALITYRIWIGKQPANKKNRS